MKCEKAQDLFSSYLENDMDSAQRSAFEQHLAECPSCEARYDRFHATVMLLEETPEVKTPPAFHSAVMMRVEQARHATPQRVRWWDIDWQRMFTVQVRAKAVAAGVAVMLILGTVVMLSPVSNITAGLFPGRGDATNIGENVEAPPGPLPPYTYRGVEADYALPGSGMNLSVTVQSTQGQGGVYDLKLEPNGNSSIDYAVYLRSGAPGSSPISEGTLGAGHGARIPVIVSEPTRTRAVVTEIEWTYEGRRHTSYVFLPSKFDQDAATRELSVSLRGADLYEAVGKVSAAYGIVIVSPGDLGDKQLDVTNQSGAAQLVLSRVTNEAGMHWQKLGSSIYAIQR